MQTILNAGADTPPAGAAPVADRSTRQAAGRADFEAFLKNGRSEEPVAKTAEPEPAAAPDADVEADAAETPAAEPEPTAPEPDEVSLDPAAAKRLAAAQKEEQRRKAAIAKERAEAQAALAKERAEIEAARKEIEAEQKSLAEFRALKQRARIAPDAVLQHLGLGAEDMVAAASALMLHDPKYANDPKAKEAVARMMREREARGEIEKTGGEVQALKAQLDEMKKLIEQRDSHQQGEAAVAAYLDDIEDSLNDEHPVTARALTTAKAKATDRAVPVAERREAQQAYRAIRDELRAVAADLYRRDGVEPEPDEVAAEVERRRVAELRRWGVDPAVLKAAPAAPAKKSTTPPPKVLARGGAAPAEARKKLSPEEERADFIRRREIGKLDDD
jgi:hypothetical protein